MMKKGQKGKQFKKKKIAEKRANEKKNYKSTKRRQKNTENRAK